MSSEDSIITRWVEDQLHSIVGFADSTLAKYIVALGKKSKNIVTLTSQLLENDLPPSNETKLFSKQLFENTLS